MHCFPDTNNTDYVQSEGGSDVAEEEQVDPENTPDMELSDVDDSAGGLARAGAKCTSALKWDLKPNLANWHLFEWVKVSALSMPCMQKIGAARKKILAYLNLWLKLKLK